MSKTPKKFQTKTSTEKHLKFFNDKLPASEVIEPEGSKKLKLSPPPSLNDRFFDFIEDQKIGSKIALAITTAFIVAIAYWGITQ